MSAALARREIHRFLRHPDPQILAITGRWGVGKTYVWNEELQKFRGDGSLVRKRYSYISAFGANSLKELRESAFQSAIRLDGVDIQPSVESLRENLSSIESAMRLGEWGTRRLAKGASALLSLVPWAGSAGELILPTAALLIKDQIICIDDIERAAPGLRVDEILGFASQMKEQRNCKVVLLLNKDGLGAHSELFEKYLEKTADQAVVFDPTTSESVQTAFRDPGPIDSIVADFVTKLGITNIRVIRRIRSFVSHVEPRFGDWHEGTVARAIQAIVLFGWCVFEPDIAPNLDAIRNYNRYEGIFDNDDVDQNNDRQVLSSMLRSYEYYGVDDFDEVIISSVKNGAFDIKSIDKFAADKNQIFMNDEARRKISRPWDLYFGSFKDNAVEIQNAIRDAIRDHSRYVQPTELSGFYELLCDLGEQAVADEILREYMELQAERPREFFQASSHPSFLRRANGAVLAAFERALAERPHIRDPLEVMVGIEKNSGWNTEDIEFLASLTTDELLEIFKSTEGDELRLAISASLRFVSAQSGPASYQEFGARVRDAFERISAESGLNAMRVRGYLGTASED